jgi:hypothetical protein
MGRMPSCTEAGQWARVVAMIVPTTRDDPVTLDRQRQKPEEMAILQGLLGCSGRSAASRCLPDPHAMGLGLAPECGGKAHAAKTSHVLDAGNLRRHRGGIVVIGVRTKPRQRKEHLLGNIISSK